MRSFKKIAAMIMAVAMLCSFTALADAPAVELNIASEVTSENPNIALGYTSTAAQTTMLVYKGTQLTGADVVYVNQFAEGADPVTLALATDADAYGDYTVVAGGMDVEKADTATFNYRALVYDVTLTGAGEGGYVSHNYTGPVTEAGVLTGIPKDTVITFDFKPFMGYEITSIMVGEEDNTTAVVSTGGKLNVTVTGNVTVAVEFTAIPADEEGQAFTSAEVYDIPATEDAEGDDALASSLVFGKATEAAGKTITQMGMIVKKVGEGGELEDVVTSKGVGPYFPALNPINNQYGLRFFGFEAGTYNMTSYVQYDDGSEVTGETVTFEVR